MCFFVPRKLVELEYLTSDDDSTVSEGYDYDHTLAFFVVNLGMSKSEFDNMTKKEVLFIMKAWETKVVRDTQLQANAFYNAYVNANRKKGKPPIKLWKKPKKKVDKNKLKQQFIEVVEYEKNNSKDWIRAIYEGR